MKTAEQCAEEYAKTMCGDSLKAEPNLNEYVPAFMRAAFLAGAAWQREQDARIALTKGQDRESVAAAIRAQNSDEHVGPVVGRKGDQGADNEGPSASYKPTTKNEGSTKTQSDDDNALPCRKCGVNWHYTRWHEHVDKANEVIEAERAQDDSRHERFTKHLLSQPPIGTGSMESTQDEDAVSFRCSKPGCECADECLTHKGRDCTCGGLEKRQAQQEVTGGKKS